MGGALFLAVLAAMGLHGAGLISAFALDLLFCSAFAYGLASILHRLGMTRWLALLLGILPSVLFVLAGLYLEGLRATPYLGLALINMLVAYAFSTGLRSERPLLIMQMVRAMKAGPEADPPFEHYAWYQGAAWVGFASLTALMALAAMISSSAREWLGPGLGGFALFQGLWFVVSHEYAQWRYQRPESWRDTIRLMARPSVWEEFDL
ncbi:MAG: hypothetical protein MRY63_10600 [Neomegalonema sp.]|nr:hypothetical protein [Neomegalonema sp.]